MKALDPKQRSSNPGDVQRRIADSMSSDLEPVIVIEPGGGWVTLGLRELWSARELLAFLMWRDIRVRYKQTALGAGWAILQPLLTMIVFTFVFGRLAGMQSQGLPYPLFCYAGLLPWTLFAQAVGRTSNSLVGSSAMLKKVYVPRLVIPLAAALSGLVDFGISLCMLFVLMLWYRIFPDAKALLLPLLIILAVCTGTGLGLWLSAINVAYRDITYVVPFLIQVGMYLTPVVFPLETVAARLARFGLPRWVYGLNPMTGVVEGFRRCLFGTGDDLLPILVASYGSAIVLLVSGAYFFRRMEGSFVDIV